MNSPHAEQSNDVDSQGPGAQPSHKVFPWLAAWQLANGHSRGKQRAQLASSDLDGVADTRTATGAQLQVAIRYGMLAAVPFEAVHLMETAGAPYIELSGGLRE